MAGWQEFWEATSVPIVVTWVLGGIAVIAFFAKGWPKIRAAVALIDALAELPSFMASTTDDVQRMKKQLENSHVTNLRDDLTEAIDGLARVELGVKGLYDRADKADLADKEIRDELEHTRPKPPARKRATKP